MTSVFWATAIFPLLAMTAQAQQTAVPPPASATPGAATSPAATRTPEAGAPLTGANSFTQSQAKSRIEDLGYKVVTDLAKDAAGVWRGKAVRGGQTNDVAIDFRGNIVIGQK